MAIDATKYQLTHLLRDAYFRMGQMRRWVLTGGDASSAINTSWAGVEEPVFEDDDPAIIGGTLLVLETTDRAAPEGEFGEITDYDSAANDMTIGTLSAALASGDKVGVASPQFPVQDMIELANLALQKLGEIDFVDTTLSVVANQTEYSMPIGIARTPIRVRRQTVQASGNNKWQDVTNWEVIPASVGSQWTLVVPPLPQNYSLQVWYQDLHPRLTSFDSYIMDTIHPELAVSALVVEAFRWYNNQLGGTNQFFLQRENQAVQDLESAIVRFPIRKSVEQVPGFPHWGKLHDYVPGTSDLRA